MALNDNIVITQGQALAAQSNESNDGKIDSNGGICGEDIVAIVRGYGKELADLDTVIEQTKKTIEQSLKDGAKLFDDLARGQEEESLTKLGVKCGLDSIVATGLAVNLMGKYRKQQSNAANEDLIAREFEISDEKGIKKRICVIARQRGLAGFVQRIAVAQEQWTCGNCKLINNTRKCIGCFSEQPKNTATLVRLEGVSSRVNAAIWDIKKFSGIDLTQFELKNVGEPQYISFTSELTDASFIRNGSSGQRAFQKSVGSGSSDSIGNSHFLLKLRLNERDKWCRLHGDDANCKLEWSNMDSWKAGHVSGVANEDKIDEIDKAGLTDTPFNAYKWCNAAEWCWTNCLFGIDFETGNAVFAPEFPFEDMHIDKNKSYKVANVDEEKENQPIFPTEPTKDLLKLRHELYVKKRKSCYEKDHLLTNKYECRVCGKRLKDANGLKLHCENLKHGKDAAKLDFQERKYYVDSLPVCNCSQCTKK